MHSGLIQKSFVVLLLVFFIGTSVWAEKSDPADLESRAGKGDVEAQVALGLLYVKGEDVEQDFAEAKKWWDTAAKQGDASAQYYLGLMYARGDGGDKDMEAAKKQWESAAGQDHIGALYSLAMLYVEGEAVQGDYTEAGKYFLRAAELGNIQSQFNISVLYAQGLGFPQSSENSYAWARLAADQGHPNAKEMLKTLEPQMSEEQMALAKAEYEKVKARVAK